MGDTTTTSGRYGKNEMFHRCDHARFTITQMASRLGILILMALHSCLLVYWTVLSLHEQMLNIPTVVDVDWNFEPQEIYSNLLVVFLLLLGGSGLGVTVFL